MKLPLVLALAGAALSAQISGIVTDPSGARVPGATVVAVDGEGHKVTTTTARADGSYAFTNLAAGRYGVEVRMPGFAIYHADDLTVGANPLRVDARLNLGRITENLVVKAQGTPRAQPAAQDSAPKPMKVGGNVAAANLIQQVRPVYPPEMKAQGLEAVVVLTAVISKEGVPLSLNSQSPEVNRAFVDASIEAVKQWRYKPTLLNGEPVEVVTTITINFTLSQ